MTDSTANWLAFAGGGTGGHITQALAVARCVKGMDADVKIVMFCSERQIDHIMLADNPCVDRLVAQPVAPLPGRSLSPLAWLKFLVRWRRSVNLVSSVFGQLKPRAVLGLGGFAAGPAMKVARGKVPAALLNPDAVPGKANRRFARRSDAIFTAQSVAAEHFPACLRDKIILSGCPVRAEIRSADRLNARKFFYGQGLKPCDRIFGIMGGSLGAETVNLAACRALSNIDNVGVIHICGPGKAGELRKLYKNSASNALVIEFCHEMGDFYAACDLAITRGGANSVAELAATSTPAVIMPYPWHKDAHQRLNAQDMANSGAAVIMTDNIDLDKNAPALKAILTDILLDPNRLPAMKAACLRCDMPEAAETVARWLISAISSGHISKG